MEITLPFSTPVTNVLRFILLEYIILKLFSTLVETFASTQAARTTVDFQERWPTFFLVPYRIRHHNLRKLVPLALVLFINALLLSIEFGFHSTTIQHRPVVESDFQISTHTLSDSAPLPGVDDQRWLIRAQRIAEKCVNRNGREVYAAEGFIRDATLDGDFQLLQTAEVICVDDSRVIDSPLSKVMFNISNTAMIDTVQPFAYALLHLNVDTLADNIFQFQGGDVDINVSGTLDLSKHARGDSDYKFDVKGSCTAFRELDPRVYCYLTDGDKNRFIVPAAFADDSDITTVAQITSGASLRLVDAGPVFRAEILLFDDSWRARDGDHLAAIKSLVLTFSPRQAPTYDDAVIHEYLPVIVRTFYMATVLGATSVRTVRMSVQTSEPQSADTERAQVTLWAFVMLCVVIGVMFPAVVILKLCTRRKGRLNVPVTYNALAEMVKQSIHLDNGGVRGPLTCGVIEDGDGVARYGPIDPAGEKKRHMDFDV